MSITVSPRARGKLQDRRRAIADRTAPATPLARPRAARIDLIHLALGALLVATLGLRLWGVKQGLPYSYDLDEAEHFVPRAIAFFGHDYNPRYFLNPPAYTYLLHVVFELWFGSGDAASKTYASSPTVVFTLARVVAGMLGTVSVWLLYLAGARLFGRPSGLLAAAVFGLAFLPIYYSHVAVNDVPTLAPVALSLWGVAGVFRKGRRRDYLIAGAGIGLAAATKYTGGITSLCLLAAAASDAADSTIGAATRRLGWALGAALAAFILANPFVVLDFHAFWRGITEQASLAAGSEPFKLGTSPGGGISYYLWTFTWGLGWVPAVAAIAGAVALLARRRVAMALMLVAVPIAFIVFMGEQQRYFGRWLLPVFPIVALLAAHGALELLRLARGALPALAARASGAWVIGAAAAVALLVQSIVTVIHDDVVLSRPDTRALARAWMVAHVPPGSRVVLEPDVPGAWATDVGRSLPQTPTGERWWRYPTWVSNVGTDGHLLPASRLRYVPVDQYERTLRPALLNQYVQHGYCWVVIGSLQAGRAFAQPRLVPGAIAYYAALARRGTLVYRITPYARGARPVPFNFDFSTDYYPSAYRLPGPEIDVYRLRGGSCS